MLRSSTGVTLIEMMVAIVIMSILIAMGVPSFAAFLANSKVRAGAESLLSGLQMARADAVRRNEDVEFLRTIAPPIAASVGAATPALNGANWMVRSTGGDFVEGKLGAESGGNQLVISSTRANVIFNSFGRTTPTTGAATFQLTNPTGGACAPGGPIRCLNVTVSNAGRIRMCDPATIDVNDSRRC